MQPFTLRTLFAVIILIVNYYIVHFLVAFPSSPIVEAILQTGIYTILCGVGLISLNVSEDVNRTYENVLGRVRRLIGR